MASEGVAVDEPSRRSMPLRTVVAAAAAFASTRPSLSRHWSRKLVQSTPPPLPLISLPPDDDWQEFDVPVKTGFGYALPHVALDEEETHDTSSTNATAVGPMAYAGRGPNLKQPQPEPTLSHDRPAICRMLSEYMAQNELFQLRRHGFGIDSALVYKRVKSAARKAGGSADSSRDNGLPASDAPGGDELVFDAFFESGNLDRAYRVLGRHYATTQELLGGGNSPAASSPSSSATGVASSAQPAPAPGSSPPFPFFVKADMEYDLYCDTDLSTHGHIQWYFFRATVPSGCFKRPSPSPSPAVLRVRFNLRNMLKKASLYNDGMLPAVYIDGARGRGWHHAGVNVCYFKSADTYRNRKSGKLAYYYTLSFVYEFQQADGPRSSPPAPLTVYFAHTYPYTFSKLQRFLLALQKDPARNRFFRRRVLCKTVAGNICDVLTITDFGQEDTTRAGVVLTARVHPGESNASFLMHGILDFLTGPSLEARHLRHRYVFKIVPMLNSDGVVHGNYRCSLAGTDLNRRYADPSPALHPTVSATKNMVLSMAKTRPIHLYCDIHGHSRKKNMFLYGCAPFDESSRAEAAKLRLFPHVLSKTCGAGSGGYFSLADCTFSVSRSKRGTGRVVVWDSAQVLNSFTLEASFFGVGVNRKRGSSMSSTSSGPPTNQPPRGASQPMTTNAKLEHAMTHFMPSDLRAAGVNVCLALIPFAHLLDRDQPPPPLPQLRAKHEDEPGAPSMPTRAFYKAAAPAECGPVGTSNPSMASGRPSTAIAASGANDRPALHPGETAVDSKLRLAPLLLQPSSGSISSTPFLLPRSPLKPALQPLPSTDSPAPSSSPSPRVAESLSPFGQLITMDGLFSSLAATDDLLCEIEDALPGDFSQGGDSDDEGDSVGSESDPSGDNMEPEELQRQDSWKQLVSTTTITAATNAPAPAPKLTKSRSQALLKRFSDSMLGTTLMADELKPPELSLDQSPVATAEPAKLAVERASVEPLKSIPVAALAPVKTPTLSAAHLLHRNAPSLHHHNASPHPRDRNKDIAALHRRAVQRRSRAKRTSQRVAMHEHVPTM